MKWISLGIIVSVLAEAEQMLHHPCRRPAETRAVCDILSILSGVG